MRYLGLPVLLFLSVLSVAAQPPFPGREDIANFMKSTTCVVLEDDAFSAYNILIKEAVTEFWDIRPYEFITEEEFDERRRDPSFSFIVLTETTYDRDKSGSAYNNLNLLQGKKVGGINQMPEICVIPLSSSSEEDIDYGYKTGAVLRFIQRHALMISESPSVTGRRYLRYYNRNIPLIAQKTILARESDLAPSVNTAEKIKALYPNSFSIVDEEEIIRAIEERRPGTLVLHRVGPVGDDGAGYCFKMLIGADDSEMYYYDQHLIDAANPNGLLPSDLKRLMRY
ncbi:MAG: hypothetical protein RBU28_07635 [Bacteroidales bacterium]|jgi:hypothetical protein|nr:hypothetical protein [Bacteroidales bacterium]